MLTGADHESGGLTAIVPLLGSDVSAATAWTDAPFFARKMYLQIAAYGYRPEGRKLAEDMLIPMLEASVQYPTAFAKWLFAADFALGPTREVAIVGKPNHSLLDVLWSEYRPRLVAAISDYPPDKHAPALLSDRPLKENIPTAYVCQNFMCKQPVNDSKELAAQLSSAAANPLD